jgi:hypothetical protein
MSATQSQDIKYINQSFKQDFSEKKACEISHLNSKTQSAEKHEQDL